MCRRVTTLALSCLLLLASLGQSTAAVSTGVAAADDCPCSIWAASAAPADANVADGAALELGVKFRSDAAGYVTGVRFYKGSQNTGTHSGSLWTAGGVRLATATFSGETAAGWQQVSFASPVAIQAGTTYVASYFAPTGVHAETPAGFAAAGVDSPPLHALRSGVDGGNGVYRYTPASAFPSQTWEATNYWVDVVFATTLGADITTPTLAAIDAAVTATFAGSSLLSSPKLDYSTIQPTVGIAMNSIASAVAMVTTSRTTKCESAFGRSIPAVCCSSTVPGPQRKQRYNRRSRESHYRKRASWRK